MKKVLILIIATLIISSSGICAEEWTVNKSSISEKESVRNFNKHKKILIDKRGRFFYPEGCVEIKGKRAKMVTLKRAIKRGMKPHRKCYEREEFLEIKQMYQKFKKEFNQKRVPDPKDLK